VLARVIELLADCSEQDFLAAAQLSLSATSPELSGALVALAAARKSFERPKNRLATQGLEMLPPVVKASRRPTTPNDSLRATFQRLFSNHLVFKSKKDLQAYLKSQGINVEIGSKDSGGRIASRVVKALDVLPNKQRRALFADLSRRAPASETEGWFQVIRGNLP